MHWQDIVLTIGSFIFAVALFPSITSKNKPALSTSLSTGIVLLIFAITYTTLSLWLAATSTTLTAIMWLILAFQKALQGRAKRRPAAPNDL